MPIQINSLSSRSLKGTGKSGKAKGSGKAQGGKAATAASTTGGGDSLNITGDAGKLQELEGRIANMPIVDAQKVEAVQQALANGSFTIDPQTCADKMLAMELSLH
ncbi:MAG: flagellar biosynthesis anti-sigma factor FlgM [Candidatus Thiodiazotropha lotti]|uniref:Negative regulator of flagellin synthesis n=1 Tax=Candidatus Thiodiazotropha lotti TaxID=2792787 RepID=A0A9E4K626_9GAMM|nr:flagellar biosynthesis anti-sigma factor FlgM [Candidatus Thiodiazotropha lotti]ODC01576.1 flagellar biosynthesis anti-sigma factor FlgM [Candidatus Thiodiazotropha endoloripes]MCG7922695.1 flagellar biosynthesis anti-sigma factor FlgM [Candidatus Thiodiazotropha lotti]MCG7932662.1 flagellar biosynthesis anti-sigma factor FlgM [Candidatus Thiodiazotropha lotti]MCG7939967.1 flagellar biosynthesis anti-sigma factor FlgM [Candidatus Thiodiazotropha lotti]